MKTWNVALRMFLVLTLLTGVAYPLLVTGIAQALWPAKAGGSLITINGEVVGSTLIAQKFEKDIYFHPRPSATDYNASASSGSNKGPTNTDLKKIYDDGVAAHILPEMIFSSASGLDPQISPIAARAQLERVATARGLTAPQKGTLRQLLATAVEERDLGFLGEARVNVLRLNMKLDEIF